MELDIRFKVDKVLEIKIDLTVPTLHLANLQETLSLTSEKIIICLSHHFFLILD